MATTAPSSLSTPLGQRAPRVIVVDPDAARAQALGVGLRDAGASIVVVRDGQEALWRIDLQPTDAIVLRIACPVLDGFGLLRALEGRPPPHPVVIGLSGIPEQAMRARREGMWAVLRSGAAVTEVVHTLERALERRPRPDEGLTEWPADEIAAERRRSTRVTQLSWTDKVSQPGVVELTHRIARLFDVPVCWASGADSWSMRWSDRHPTLPTLRGIAGRPRSDLFCTHVVESGEPWIMADALSDPLGAETPLSIRHGIRFYAGVPLRAADGTLLGALSIMDVRPRLFDHNDLRLLEELALAVAAAVEPGGASDRWDPDLGVLGRTTFLQLLRLLPGRTRGAELVLVTPQPADSLEILRNPAELLSARLPAAFVGRLDRATVCALGWGAGTRTATQSVEATIGSPQVYVRRWHVSQAGRLEVPTVVPSWTAGIPASPAPAPLSPPAPVPPAP